MGRFNGKQDDFELFSFWFESGIFCSVGTGILHGNVQEMLSPFNWMILDKFVTLMEYEALDQNNQIFRFGKSATIISTANAPAMGARPGRVTVHSWSNVRSLVEFSGATTSLQK